MTTNQLYLEDDTRYCGGFIDEKQEFYESEAEYYLLQGFWDAVKGIRPDEREIFDRNYMNGYRLGKKEKALLV